MIVSVLLKWLYLYSLSFNIVSLYWILKTMKTILYLRKTKTHQLSVTFTRKSYIQFHLKLRILTILSFEYKTLAPHSHSNQCFCCFCTNFSHTQFLALIGKKLKCIPQRNRINKRQVHKRKPLGHWIKYFPMNLKKITGTCLHVSFHPWKL